MISAHQYAPFLLENLFGSLLPLLENSNPSGKEIGSSNPSKVQEIWKSRMEKTQKWFTQIDCNIAMFQAHLMELTQIWMLPTNSGMHQQLTMFTCPLPCQLCPDVIHCDSDMLYQMFLDSAAVYIILCCCVQRETCADSELLLHIQIGQCLTLNY